MTDEVQQGIAANQPTVEEVEAKRQADALETAKAGGYVEPPAPSIRDRVDALVAGVEAAMSHNAPISAEYFNEMKELLGFRGVADESKPTA